MVHQVRITGEVPNLRMLLADLVDNREFAAGASASIARAEQDGHRLGNAELATLVIEVTVGVAGSAVYDSIKYALAAARRRGVIATEGLEQQSAPVAEQRPAPGLEERSDLREDAPDRTVSGS